MPPGHELNGFRNNTPSQDSHIKKAQNNPYKKGEAEACHGDCLFT